MLIKSPFQIINFLLLSTLLIGGFTIRVFERPWVISSPDRGFQVNDFADFQNSLWVVIPTITTVGYGIYFPETTAGRTVGVLLCLSGVLTVALIVTAGSSSLQLDTSQKNCFSIMQRLEFKKSYADIAARLIGSIYRYRLL
jgi:hypothetical protein